MKSQYRDLCDTEPSIPLFSQAWWLDAVAGGSWDVALVYRGGDIAAALPYVEKKYLGRTVLSQPPLTQTLGPWIRNPDSKHYAKRLSREKDLMEALIEQLPPYAHYSQNWHYTQTNWLPFFWKGFRQTTRYTYRVESLGDDDALWSKLQTSIRRNIKKAVDREGVTVRTNWGIDEFFDLNCKVFQRQGQPVPHTKALVESIDAAAERRGVRKIFVAEDAKSRRHAGVYLVWDHSSAYYLMGGSDPELRRSGASSLCLWEAIRFAATVTRSFDFEGSMLEPVERVFRSFGAIQTPYFCVSHTPSRLIRAALLLRDLKG